VFLLDTNVISELRKVRAGTADPQVARWAKQSEATQLFLSVITIQELEIGVLRMERRDAKQGRLLRIWLDQHVLPAFEGRILSIDTAISIRSATLSVPDPLPVRDGFIAATALVHQMTVVTRNTTDFAASGVKLLNPWSAQR
jgi:toxin FitB